MLHGPLIDDVARSLAFLSRLPLPDRFFAGHDGRLSRAVRAFPLAGLLVGLAPAALLAGLSAAGAEPLLASALAVALSAWLTGGLHEDGLADTCDGLGGSANRERALEIMKDSRIGAYGAIALVLTLIIRIAALAGLAAALSPVAAGLAVLAVAVLSRTAMIVHWAHLPAARSGGVAAAVGAPDPAAARTGEILGLALGAALALAGTGALAAFASIALAAAAVWRLTALARSRLGGHTGDTIGASQQISETVMLAGLALLT